MYMYMPVESGSDICNRRNKQVYPPSLGI